MLRRFAMKLVVIQLCMGAMVSASFAADDSAEKISKESADKLLSSVKFKSVKSKDEIPKLSWQAENLDNLSDIGGPFSPGCTGQESHLRLMLGAVTEPYSVIITEQGGIAYLTEFKIYKHEKNAVHLIDSEMVHEPRIDQIRRKFNAD